MLKCFYKGGSMRILVKNLSFAYTQKFVLNKINFSLANGDFLSVVGKNGSGKSTLIKCLIGLLKVGRDQIYLDDIDINDYKKMFKIGYVPQKVDFNYEFPITVKEVLSAAYRKRRDSFYASVINSLDLNRFYYDNINTLSGGQLQRIFIARALLNHPKLLILDEPTSGVDQTNIESLIVTLRQLKEHDITIILVTHDEALVNKLSDYVLELDETLDYTFYKVGEQV